MQRLGLPAGRLAERARHRHVGPDLGDLHRRPVLRRRGLQRRDQPQRGRDQLPQALHPGEGQRLSERPGLVRPHRVRRPGDQRQRPPAADHRGHGDRDARDLRQRQPGGLALALQPDADLAERLFHQHLRPHRARAGRGRIRQGRELRPHPDRPRAGGVQRDLSAGVGLAQHQRGDQLRRLPAHRPAGQRRSLVCAQVRRPAAAAPGDHDRRQRLPRGQLLCPGRHPEHLDQPELPGQLVDQPRA